MSVKQVAYLHLFHARILRRGIFNEFISSIPVHALNILLLKSVQELVTTYEVKDINKRGALEWSHFISPFYPSL